MGPLHSWASGHLLRNLQVPEPLEGCQPLPLGLLQAGLQEDNVWLTVLRNAWLCGIRLEPEMSIYFWTWPPPTWHRSQASPPPVAGIKAGLSHMSHESHLRVRIRLVALGTVAGLSQCSLHHG